MKNWGTWASILLGLATAAALASPWPTQMAIVLAALHVAAAVALYAVASVADSETRVSMPLWVIGLSVARLAAAIAVAREALTWSLGETAAPFGFGPSSALSLAIATVLLSVLTFAVIGSGGVRVAEVAARFSLDALPGKQLGLDTAVHSGALPVAHASEELARMEREAHFYGAMDGAMRFLRAEAAGIVVAGVLSAAAGAALHPQHYAGVIAIVSGLSGALLLACAVTGSAAVRAVTAAISAGSAQPTKRGLLMRLAWAAASSGLAFVVVGLLAWPPMWALVGIGLAFSGLGAAVAFRTYQARESEKPAAEGHGDWALVVPAAALQALLNEAPRFIELVRQWAAYRLGFDPGSPDIIKTGRQTSADNQGSNVQLLVRGLPVAELQYYPQHWFAEEPQESGVECTGPDGRPGWRLGPGSSADGALPWWEILAWGVLRHLVGVADLLITPARAAQWAGSARRELEAAGLSGTVVGTSWIMAHARELVRTGLPVPAPALLADAAAHETLDEQRSWLRKVALRMLIGHGQQGVMARQLHFTSGRLLEALKRGERSGEQLDQLRESVIRSSWERPSWALPMLLVEVAERDQMAQLLADRVAEIVVVAPEELPVAVALPPIEVLGLGSEQTRLFPTNTHHE